MLFRSAIIAQQQQQQAIADQQAQQAQQQQDMQNQIAYNAQSQIAQAHVQKEVDKIVSPDQKKSEEKTRSHEANMADKKIELEKIKSKTDIAKAKQAAKSVEKKPKPAKKKTVAEEAKDLGLIYIGNGRYADKAGTVTHLNENGILLPYINKE